MRIIGGNLRHRKIEMTNLETTRETQDSVRESIYNMIGPYFDGGICLDLFAGSGAMGIEAYSRGMNEIHLNDIENKALDVCKLNCKSLGITNVKFTNYDYDLFLKNNKTIYDLIILDPPYKMNEIGAILNGVYPFIKEKGLIVFEMAKESIYPEEFDGLDLIKNKTYGIKRVVVYKRKV